MLVLVVHILKLRYTKISPELKMYSLYKVLLTEKDTRKPQRTIQQKCDIPCTKAKVVGEGQNQEKSQSRFMSEETA